MSRAPANPRDPLGWCIAIALGFWALTLIRLTIPTKPYFDEVHYLPAAREYLALDTFINREHPLVGKEFIALGITLFGDNPFGWRIMSSIGGMLALFGAMRALWFATLSRFATIAYGILLITGFMLFIHSRIAMLDMFMVTFAALAYWQLAGALREPETGRWRLALAGIFLGLSIGAKWNSVPIAALAGAAFLVIRANAGRRRLLLSRRGLPVPGISLVEAGFWLGVVPLAVYTLTYLPGWFFAHGAIGTPSGSTNFFTFHLDALKLQESVIKKHPYMSRWWQWVFDIRSIWYLYEHVDGAQRGVVLIGNPLTMLLGLPALIWAAWAGFVKRNAAAAGVFLIYALSLGMWIVADKPVQFYYHYFLPSMALFAALALALDALRQRGHWIMAWTPLVLSVVVFVYFYPILSAARLSGKLAYVHWMWINVWR